MIGELAVDIDEINENCDIEVNNNDITQDLDRCY